jgi:translocator protein
MLNIEIFQDLVMAALVLWPPLITNNVSPAGVEFYRRARKGDAIKGIKGVGWSPKSSIFGPVWTVLFGLIATVGILFLNYESFDSIIGITRMTTLALFFINLSLNHVWTRLFFGWHSFFMAFVDALAIFGTGVAVLVLFAIAGKWLCFWLYIPYVAWSLFASMLSCKWWIYFANPKKVRNMKDLMKVVGATKYEY